jgi:hypothetical protein
MRKSCEIGQRERRVKQRDRVCGTTREVSETTREVSDWHSNCRARGARVDRDDGTHATYNDTGMVNITLATHPRVSSIRLGSRGIPSIQYFKTPRFVSRLSPDFRCLNLSLATFSCTFSLSFALFLLVFALAEGLSWTPFWRAPLSPLPAHVTVLVGVAFDNVVVGLLVVFENLWQAVTCICRFVQFDVVQSPLRQLRERVCFIVSLQGLCNALAGKIVFTLVLN